MMVERLHPECIAALNQTKVNNNYNTHPCKTYSAIRLCIDIYQCFLQFLAISSDCVLVFQLEFQWWVTTTSAWWIFMTQWMFSLQNSDQKWYQYRSSGVPDNGSRCSQLSCVALLETPHNSSCRSRDVSLCSFLNVYHIIKHKNDWNFKYFYQIIQDTT